MQLLRSRLLVFLPLILAIGVLALSAIAVWTLFRNEWLPTLVCVAIILVLVGINKWCNGWLTHDTDGRKALAKHDYAAAADAFRIGLARGYADDDPRRGMLLDGLGQAHKGLGDFTEAEAYGRQALAVNERAWGPDHYRTLATAVNLANIYLELAKFDEAAALYRQVHEQVERRYGPNHRDVAICLNNLGRVFSDREHHAAAEPYYRRALQIMQSRYRANHFFVAFMHNNLGFVLARLGRLDEAATHLEQALSVFGGKQDLHEAMALSNLSWVRLKQDRLEEADELIQSAYTLHKRILGTSHPQHAPILHCLAEVLIAQQRWDKAEDACQRQLHLCESYLVPTHPSLVRCLEQYARLLERMQRPAEAARLRQRADPIRACLAAQPAFAADTDLASAIKIANP